MYTCIYACKHMNIYIYNIILNDICVDEYMNK